MVSYGNGPGWDAAAEDNVLARFLRRGEPVDKLVLVPTDCGPNSGIVKLALYPFGNGCVAIKPCFMAYCVKKGRQQRNNQ